MDYTDFIVERAQHMRPLEYDLSESYNGLLRYMRDMGILENIPVGSIGPSEIVSTNDALAASLRSLVVVGNSVQNETPSPSAPVPINSVVNPALKFTGKNLFDYPTEPWTNTASTVYNSNTFSGGYREIPNGITTITASMYIDNSAATGPSLLNAWAIRSDGTIVAIGASIEVAAGTRAHVSKTYDVSSYKYFGLGARLYPNASASQLMAEIGSIATDYEPYQENAITIPVTLRGLPDGTRDNATYTYLRASEHDGYAWYAGVITRKTGQTVQAVTDGVTGIIGVDVLSTTGEIADGPTVIYKLATPTTETLNPIELPNVFGPNFTLWGTSDTTPQLMTQYVRDISAVINDMQEVIADL